MSDAARRIDARLLAAWPLPQPSPDADKEARGRVLVVAGSAQMPGAAILAATAALRAGAGKLSVATAETTAAQVAHALPEARVISLPESPPERAAERAASILEPLLEKVDAVLIGPGMEPEEHACALVRAVLARLPADVALVLDAAAMNAIGTDGGPDGGATRPMLLTPHAGEMAHLLGLAKDEVVGEPERLALDCARRWGANVALKGAITWIATPDGRRWRHDGGGPGLGCSGSGDVLAGLAVGLAARGAPLDQAAAWAVALHARAGDALSRRFGPLGYLARELSAEVPALMAALAGARPAKPARARAVRSSSRFAPGARARTR